MGKLYCVEIGWAADKYNIRKNAIIAPISIKHIQANFCTVTWLTQADMLITDTWNRKICLAHSWYDLHVRPIA